jgi:hypothetical protein
VIETETACYLNLEAAELSYDGAESRGDQIQKLFVMLIHIFIISTLCYVFISLLAVSVEDLLHPNLLVLVSRYSFGYVGPVIHHVLSAAELKVLHTHSPVLPSYVISVPCDLHHRIMVLFR